MKRNPTYQKKETKQTSNNFDENKAKELKPGDEVKLLTLDQKGTIIEQSGKNEFQVQVGIMKLKAKRKDLLFIRREEPKVEKPLATVRGAHYHVKQNWICVGSDMRMPSNSWKSI